VIYYYSSDNNKPAGGTFVNYRHVDALNANGIGAAILHHEPGFRIDWFENETCIEYMDQVEGSPDDIVVISAFLEHEYASVFPGMKKVIFNQGAYCTFALYPFGYTGGYNYDDALATLTVSEDSARYLRHAFPNACIFRTVNGIDPKLYYYDAGQKREQIAFMPRKNPDCAKQIICILRARGVKYPIVPIDEVSREEAARIMRESKIFMNFAELEGFGMPPAEAMACGCVTIGHHGGGGREFLKSPCAIPIGYEDIVGYVKAVEAAITDEITVDVQAASDFIHREYSPERESESIVNAWREILELTCALPANNFIIASKAEHQERRNETALFSKTDRLWRSGHPNGLGKKYAHKISLVYNLENGTFYMYYCAVGDQGRGIGLLASKALTNGGNP